MEKDRLHQVQLGIWNHYRTKSQFGIEWRLVFDRMEFGLQDRHSDSDAQHWWLSRTEFIDGIVSNSLFRVRIIWLVLVQGSKKLLLEK